MIEQVNAAYVSQSITDAGRAAGKDTPALSRNDGRKTSVRDRVSISANSRDSRNGSRAPDALTAEQKQQVKALKKRDAEVKAHERAHLAAGGGLVQGAASYQYEVGPDGKRYAVGGEVKIDVSPERTPEATIRKMQQVKAAALAPAQPSATDRAVAARAAQLEAKARAEKARQEREALTTEQVPPAAAAAAEQAQTPEIGVAGRVTASSNTTAHQQYRRNWLPASRSGAVGRHINLSA